MLGHIASSVTFSFAAHVDGLHVLHGTVCHTGCLSPGGRHSEFLLFVSLLPQTLR